MKLIDVLRKKGTDESDVVAGTSQFIIFSNQFLQRSIQQCVQYNYNAMIKLRCNLNGRIWFDSYKKNGDRRLIYKYIYIKVD